MGRKPKNIKNQTFGRLTALEPTDKKIGTSIVWKCRCSCDGKIIEASASSLISGNIKSCGCLKNNAVPVNTGKDLTEKQFGRLTAHSPTGRRDQNRSIIWECSCSCDGKTVEVSAARLLSGHVQSCGCLQKTVVSADITGKVFGQIEAVRPTEKRSHGHVLWLCECVDCGNQVYVTANHLKTGNTKRCPRCGKDNNSKGDG